MLQKENQYLSCASNLIKRAVDQMKLLRKAFDEVKEEAVNLAHVWGVNEKFQLERIKKISRRFDDFAIDQRLTDPEKQFQINVFFSSMDIGISQLEHRFNGIDVVVTSFSCLSPHYMSLDSTTDENLYNSATNLSNMYAEDISDDFPNQLVSFRSLFKEEIQGISSVSDLAHMLVVKYHSLLPSFQDVYAAFLLFLTLPVTVATAERSFSKLKLIKTYLRNTMMQNRLLGLAVISIENLEARRVNINKIINEFAKLKVRRKL